MTNENADGVVVLGTLRSGTTLVRRLLDSHPEICCPPETNLLVAAGRFLSEDRAAGGVNVGVLSGLGFSGFDGREVLDRLRDLVLGFMEEIAGKAGCPVWAEKTAASAFYTDEIERLLEDRVRYLLVTRHPLDCVSSQKELTDKMEMFLPELHSYVRRDLSLYAALAEGWADVNTKILNLKRKRPDSCLLVRYEDLVADPEKELARIFNFLERPTETGSVLARSFETTGDVGLGDWKTYTTKKVHQGSVGRWKRLSFDTLRKIIPIVRGVAEELRYELVDVGDELDEDEARHQFQLGLMVAQMRSNPSEDK